MDKYKNKLYDMFINLKQFVKDNRKQSIFFATLIFSLGIYYIVFAEDNDPYAGKIISETSASTFTSGTAPFDSDDEAGNDSNDTNNIVRNFDSMTYSLSYKLSKSSDIASEDVPNRTVVIDILIPENITADVDVTSNAPVTKEGDIVTIGEKKYTYYHTKASAKIDDQSETGIILYNINHISGSNTFSPIFQIREETENVTPLSQVKELTDSHIISFNDVTISEKESYVIKAFSGNISKSGSISTVPVGVIAYLPYNSTKGIKGLKMPSTISYKLSAAATKGTLTGPTISDYKSDSGFKINKMPYSSTDETENSLNGTATYSEGTVTIENFGFNSNNIYKVDSTQENPTGIYLTSNAYLYELDRTGVSEDITINASAGNSSVTLTSYASDVVGDLVTKVSYLDENKKTNSVYNYGESLYIRTKLSYVNTENSIGDTLNGLTSYIKFDNSAINLQQMEDGSEYNIELKSSVGSYESEDENNQISYGITYATGSWDASVWEKADNAPSTCPDVNTLTREQIMNLYGGPCIKPKTALEFKSLSEIENKNEIIVGKFSIDKVYPSTDINIYMKGKMVSSSSIVGNTYQTVVSSITTVDDNTYYLGKIANNSAENQKLMINKDNYIKSTYQNTVLSKDSPSGEHGCTLLVSAVKVSVDSINTYSDDIPKTIFTAGADDPIIWKINASGKKNSTDVSYEKAMVHVYIPTSLVFYQDKSAKVYKSTGTEVVDGITYRIYKYEFDKNEINEDGNIDELLVYTNIAPEAENNSEPKIIVKADYQVKVETNGVVVKSTSVEPVENRTLTKAIRVYNNRKISLNGVATPQLLELKNSYQYNMKAYNNSGESKDLQLVNVLPTSSETGTSFDGTYSVRIDSLPAGYTAYYTKETSGTILSTELSNPALNKWQIWNNSNIDISGITGIKIVSTNKTAYKNYFGTSDGITLTITPIDNKIGNEYTNNFAIIDINDKSSGAYMTGDSIVSVYNRRISGFVYEDFDYDGLYGEKEEVLEDLEVELYKLSNVPSDYKETDILKYISETDELVDSTTTDENGNYTFKGLDIGYYYVRFKFDSDKYTVTDYEKKDTSKGDTTQINSKFYMEEQSQNAVSKVLYVNNQKLKVNYVNLGLRVRQAFGINLEKYITNVKVISDKGTDNYNYDKAKQVKIDIKNLRNTKIEVTYKFELENSKYFPGYVGTIVETIPDGMIFDNSLKENYGWTGKDGIIYYTGLSNTLIMPGEKYYFQIKLSLSGEEAGDYINVISAGDLRLMETLQNSTSEKIDAEEDN